MKGKWRNELEWEGRNELEGKRTRSVLKLKAWPFRPFRPIMHDSAKIPSIQRKKPRIIIHRIHWFFMHMIKKLLVLVAFFGSKWVLMHPFGICVWNWSEMKWAHMNIVLCSLSTIVDWGKSTLSEKYSRYRGENRKCVQCSWTINPMNFVCFLLHIRAGW